MSKDNARMHGHNTPGMVGGRGHERHEDPVRLNHPEPGEDQPGMKGQRREETGDMREEQPSALGGHTATPTSTERTPKDERDA